MKIPRWRSMKLFLNTDCYYCYSMNLDHTQMVLFCQVKTSCDRLIWAHWINSYLSAVLHGCLSQNQQEYLLRNIFVGLLTLRITFSSLSFVFYPKSFIWSKLFLMNETNNNHRCLIDHSQDIFLQFEFKRVSKISNRTVNPNEFFSSTPNRTSYFRCSCLKWFSWDSCTWNKDIW